jgi:WhiB family redox-sensing transcriptional regulator
LADACLAGALERAESWGVWGGQLLVDGVIVAIKRGRGRPPKHPRPQIIVDEVPVPPHLVA